MWAVDSSGAPHPYHPHTGWPIDTETIRGSARDVANIADVDLICPFHNVPWWDSKLEPPSVHRDWYVYDTISCEQAPSPFMMIFF